MGKGKREKRKKSGGIGKVKPEQNFWLWL